MASKVQRPSDISSGASETSTTGFHESRVTKHGLFSPWVREGGATGNRRPDHCAHRQVTVSRFTVVHHCSLLFAIVRQKILFGASVPRGPVTACLPRIARHGAAIARHARGGVGGEPVSLPRPPFPVGLAASVAAGQLPLPRTQNEPMLRKGCVPDSVGAPRGHFYCLLTTLGLAD